MLEEVEFAAQDTLPVFADVVGQHLQCQLKVQTAPKIELREAHPGGYNPPIGTYRIVILLVLIGVAFHQQSNQ